MCTVLLPPGGYPIAVKYIIWKLKSNKISLSFNLQTVIVSIVLIMIDYYIDYDYCL